MKFNRAHRVNLAAVLFENLIDDFGFVIGRADKRYTLWKYRKENDTLTLKYAQVLSNKRFTVEMRFPGIFICEELRGEHRIVINKGSVKTKPATAPKTIMDFINLPFGEFSGVNISALTDKNWCRVANDGNFKWSDAYNKEFDFEDLVNEKLNAFGCVKVCNKWYTKEQMVNPKLWMYLANTNANTAEYDAICKSLDCIKMAGKWYSATPSDDEKPWMSTAREILPHVDNNEPFKFVAHFNGNSFFFGLPIEFKTEDKEDVYTYYGSAHYLKVTNKKGIKINKRVKGKTIEVVDYDVIDGSNGQYILVNKFNII